LTIWKKNKNRVMDFEICIDSVEAAIIASKYGAKRVELCASLNEGGLTPSMAMIESCVKTSTAEVYVMIRPSSGGFVYTDKELLIMKNDIKAVKGIGAHGVVFGILDEKGEVDIKRNMFLMESAKKFGLGSTFHRAIDVCSDPVNGIEAIVKLGFDRVLTSGQQDKAINGINMLLKMMATANQRIEVMAGSGVSSLNALELARTGINALHFTARIPINENLQLDMGQKYTVDEEKIKAIIGKF